MRFCHNSMANSVFSGDVRLDVDTHPLVVPFDLDCGTLLGKALHFLLIKIFHGLEDLQTQGRVAVHRSGDSRLEDAHERSARCNDCDRVFIGVLVHQDPDLERGTTHRILGSGSCKGHRNGAGTAQSGLHFSQKDIQDRLICHKTVSSFLLILFQGQ